MIFSKKRKHPVLYEINTHILLQRYARTKGPVTLKDIPDLYWHKCADQGIDYIWLMGIWQTSEAACKKYCFTSDLMMEYSQSVPDWDPGDVIGSPYAIDTYTIHHGAGTEEEIRALKGKLNELGIKLILDFVPNHYSACSRLTMENPDLFLQGDKEDITHFPGIFYTSGHGFPILAHGRDPYFDPWQDTAQVNIWHKKARDFQIKALLHIASLCDGVRCDMAMLLLSDIFSNTWKEFLKKRGFTQPEDEFWDNAIKKVKQNYHEFLFIAEAYWDTGWRLQNMGFDYTYDKELYDRLRYSDVPDILAHLKAEKEYQQKSVRFIENHDEKRAAACFGDKKSRAAASVISTIQGLCFIHDGQYEGKKIKLPVQLGREREEPRRKDMTQFYKRLLQIRRSTILQKGTWQLLQPVSAWEGNGSYRNYLTWIWIHQHTYLLVSINYSHFKSQCRIFLDIPRLPPLIMMNDLLGGMSYRKETKELLTAGLFIEREAYEGHIFYFKAE
jgi:hypothetical protein